MTFSVSCFSGFVTLNRHAYAWISMTAKELVFLKEDAATYFPATELFETVGCPNAWGSNGKIINF